MTHEELISFLTEGRQHNITNYLMNWFDVSDRFKDFCYKYRYKIRSKFRKASKNEFLDDLRFELESAYLLLLDQRFELEYEKDSSKKVRAPDFFVTYMKSVSFNVEVTSIRETEIGTRFVSSFQEIEEKVRKIPSDLCVKVSPKNPMDPDPKIVDLLELSKEEIVNSIEKAIEIAKNELAYDSESEGPLEGFEKDFSIMLTRPSGKDDKIHTSFDPPSRPIFYTQEEYKKFVDKVCEKLGQMKSDMANLLIIGTTNTTHEQEDLIRAIDSINDLNEENFFVQKGFLGKKDFIERMKNMSSILFRNNWIGMRNNNRANYRNLLWNNEQANQKIPEEIIEYLRKMDKPRK